MKKTKEAGFLKKVNLLFLPASSLSLLCLWLEFVGLSQVANMVGEVVAHVWRNKGSLSVETCERCYPYRFSQLDFNWMHRHLVVMNIH